MSKQWYVCKIWIPPSIACQDATLCQINAKKNITCLCFSQVWKLLQQDWLHWHQLRWMRQLSGPDHSRWFWLRLLSNTKGWLYYWPRIELIGICNTFARAVILSCLGKVLAFQTRKARLWEMESGRMELGWYVTLLQENREQCCPSRFTSAWKKWSNYVDEDSLRFLIVSKVSPTFRGESARFLGSKGLYLAPILPRSNLQVLENKHTHQFRSFLAATVTKVLFQGNPLIAFGVEYKQDGQRKTVIARMEVILTAGVSNSPKLLLSGNLSLNHMESKYWVIYQVKFFASTLTRRCWNLHNRG